MFERHIENINLKVNQMAGWVYCIASIPSELFLISAHVKDWSNTINYQYNKIYFGTHKYKHNVSYINIYLDKKIKVCLKDT